MLFQLHIHLTEADYLSFNHFHALESTHGKKMLNKSRLIFSLIMVCMATLVVLITGLTTFSVSYAIIVLLFTSLYVGFYKKMAARNIKKQMERLKKVGKLPFAPASTFEFSDDKVVEITPFKRAEQTYPILERICVVKDRFILLYLSSMSAHILPISQVKAQLDQESFIAFLSAKCANIEYY